MQRGKQKECGPHGDAAMSFKEIGEALGITRGGAWMAYASAMRKLALLPDHPEVRKLKELVEFKLRREV